MQSHSNPEHYTQYNLQPAQFILRNKLSYWQGNIIKYVCRAGHKEIAGLTKIEAEIQDLEKAIRYARMRINQLNGEVDL